MLIELIYDPDCPNVPEARTQLLRAFAETGISPRWVEWRLDSAETPAYARAFGSPTLLVNGQDVVEQTSTFGNACCRLYADPSGTLQGAPSPRTNCGRIASVPIVGIRTGDSFHAHRPIQRRKAESVTGTCVATRGQIRYLQEKMR